jgi:uncharacterized protein with ATP-grasp and redox domains
MVIAIAFMEMNVEAIDNGSDAPGTILNDCSEEFRRRFAEADLIVAKVREILRLLYQITKERQQIEHPV